MKISQLYDLNYTLAREYLKKFEYPWEALGGIKDFITEIGSSLDENYIAVSENVWVHKTAKVAPTAYLGAPCIV